MLSAIGRDLGREAHPGCCFAHPQFHFLVRKIENAESQRRIADRLAVERDACIRDGITGTLVHENCPDRQLLARRYKHSELGVLNSSKASNAEQTFAAY